MINESDCNIAIFASTSIILLWLGEITHMITDINMLIFNFEHFLSDIRVQGYLHLKKVYFFVGHPVYHHKKTVVICIIDKKTKSLTVEIVELMTKY